MWLVYLYRCCKKCYVLCLGIQRNLLVSFKYAAYGTVINICTAKRRYWQNHIDYILAINAPSLLCEEPSAATVVFGLQYTISPLNSSWVLPIILCWFHCIHFEMWNIYYWKINAENIVVTKVDWQTITMKQKYFTCVWTNTTQHAILCSWDSSIHFSI